MDVDMSLINTRSETHSLFTCASNMIFISNLKQEITSCQLAPILGQYGAVQWCHVITGNGGRSLGYAYAKFEDYTSIKMVWENPGAVEELNGGKKIYVQQSEILGTTRFLDAGKLHVKGLTAAVTDDHLKDVFGKVGTYYGIVRTSVETATIHYTNEYFSKVATAAFNGSDVFRSKISVIHYDRQRARPINATRLTLLPYNLHPDMDNAQLTLMFSFLGNVAARVLRNADGSSRGRGYVFLEKPSADTPILCLFAEKTLSNGDILLEQKVGNMFQMKRFAKKEPVIPNYQRFYPSAIPPILRTYYRKPEYFRKYHTGEVEHFKSEYEAEMMIKYQSCYHVHVTNFGDHTTMTLATVFEVYGSIRYVTIREDGGQYGLVAFQVLDDATAAVQDLEKQRQDGLTTIVAEIVDCYQVYHADDIISKNREDAIREGRGPIQEDYLYRLEENGTLKRLPLAAIEPVFQANISQIREQTNQAMAEFEKLSCEPTTTSDAASETVGEKDEDVPERPQEKYRQKLVEKMAKLFQRSADVDQNGMVQAALQIPIEQLETLMKNEKAFRMHFIKQAVEEKKRKK